ncbi:hypothetical protein [Actinoplanes sp. DH11]|uniref:hypothetical protein n=1 Tax=Actinoplanes sp. DH11 TaxID=2857011 RepID=UPI001E3F375D|nr:hypothetical protein [Actinoplanes sp. DH11]
MEFDDRLAATLRQHAGGAVDAAALVAGARRRGAGIRRRRALGWVGAVVLGVCAGVAVLSRPATTHQWATSALPVALPGQGAQQHPAAVGTDPGVLHFTADALVAGADTVSWSAGRGTETVEFRGPDRQGRLTLARDAAALDGLRQTLASSGQPGAPAEVAVAGRAGTVTRDPGVGGPDLWILRWEPVGGVRARLDMYAADSTAVMAAAGEVRFDGGLRCAVPFRLTVLPAGARVRQCSVGFDRASGPFSEGSLVVGDDQGRWLTVRAQRSEHGDGRAGTITAGPWTARRQGSGILETFVHPGQVEVFFDGLGEGYAETDAVAVLSGYTPADDVNDPGSW